MSGSELSRLVKPRALPAGTLVVEANEAERAALALRCGIDAVGSLRAEVAFTPDGERTVADGTLSATVFQPCAVTQDSFGYTIDEPLHLVFVPQGAARAYAPDEEIELDADDLDEIEYAGEAFDLGEAIAQTLALAIDPYREGPGADAARKTAGIVSDEDVEPSGPLAEALRGLRGD